MQKLTILGSAAAEGIPAIFCDCRVCREAWKNGGKDMRLRTSYQLGDHIRVDFGPDAMAQEYKYRLHSENLRYLFMTHSHEDHLAADTLLNYRCPGFSVVPPEKMLNIYGNSGVIRAIWRHFGTLPEFRGDLTRYRVATHCVEPFQPIELPEEDVTCWPLAADHMPVEHPNFYAFRVGGSYLLIANDTGDFPAESWRFLEEKRFPFEVVICDCTGAKLDWEHNHLGGKYVRVVRDRLRSLGANGRFVVNHFSHNGGATHAELEEYFQPHGIEVGFDGMTFDL